MPMPNAAMMTMKCTPPAPACFSPRRASQSFVFRLFQSDRCQYRLPVAYGLRARMLMMRVRYYIEEASHVTVAGRNI